jgi:hypothetical protein
VATTWAVGEYVGKEFGHEMRMLMLIGKGAPFAAPTLGVKIMMSTSRRKQSMMTRRRKYLPYTGPM